MKYRVPEINRGKFEKAGIPAIAGKLASLIIRQFLNSYWWRATAETVVPHQVIRATRTAFP